MIRISMKDVSKATVFLQLKKNLINGNVKQAMQEVGEHMQNEVKLSIAGHKAEPTSVDTGHLMRHIFEQASKKDVIIYTHVPYAPIIENSTKISGGPRRHFQNSLNRNKLKIKEIIKKHINI